MRIIGTLKKQDDDEQDERGGGATTQVALFKDGFIDILDHRSARSVGIAEGEHEVARKA